MIKKNFPEKNIFTKIINIIKKTLNNIGVIING